MSHVEAYHRLVGDTPDYMVHTMAHILVPCQEYCYFDSNKAQYYSLGEDLLVMVELAFKRGVQLGDN